MINTTPSIRWDTINAPCAATPADLYRGHLADGSSVQAHSADRFYAAHGIVMVAHYSPGRRIVWTATRYGADIISGYRHDATLNAALGLIVGA